jgi:deoxyadenosine/deoxycytidine kinase
MCGCIFKFFYYSFLAACAWFVIIVVFTVAPAPAILLILATLMVLFFVGFFFSSRKMIEWMYKLIQDDYSLVLIEGPIGAGKTTLFQFLQDKLARKFLWRPVFRAEAIDPGELERFYRDQKERCKSFDKNLQERREKEWAVMTRSWRQSVCDRQLISTICFARVNYILGNLTWPEYQKLMTVHEFFNKACHFRSRDYMRRRVVVVCMMTDFGVCHARAVARMNGQNIEYRVAARTGHQQHSTHTPTLGRNARVSVAVRRRVRSLLTLLRASTWHRHTRRSQ